MVFFYYAVAGYGNPVMEERLVVFCIMVIPERFFLPRAEGVA